MVVYTGDLDAKTTQRTSMVNQLLSEHAQLHNKLEECKQEWNENYIVTAYSANDPLQGTNNITAVGVNLDKHWTDEINLFAVDPDVIPLYSIIGVRFECGKTIYGPTVDTGGLIKGQRIDWYRSTKEEAIQFGVRKAEVKILD